MLKYIRKGPYPKDVEETDAWTIRHLTNGWPAGTMPTPSAMPAE